MNLPKKRKESFSISSALPEDRKKFSNKEEKKIAKEIGGKRTVNSGAKFFDPADIKIEETLIEVKSAQTQRQIIITVDMLDKLITQANRVGKNPVLMLNFPNSKLRNKKWILVPYDNTT